MQTIIDTCTVLPMVNQVEAHVFMQQKPFQEAMAAYGIQLAAWSPLASGRKNIFRNTTLTTVAASHQRSVAQVALRFLYQKGMILIPKTVQIERMQENIAIFDFALTPAEVEAIETLDTGKSLFGWY